MSLFRSFRRQREDPEVARRKLLLRAGRIVEGAISDLGTDDAGQPTHIFYSYTVSGVEYESSQYLDTEQRGRSSEYTPGSSVTVRYDPHQPVNSVVV